MHMEMLLVLLLSLVICQFVILFWKNYHLKSYQVKRILPKKLQSIFFLQFFTMLAMWLIPFGLSIKFFYFRFIFIWICFTLITIYVTRRATRQPIEPNTPRLNFSIP